MKKMIDMRTDTSTKPDAGMRRAMAAAKVGNDDFREDPTVNRLEEMSAKLLGKESAIFMPSGTMANLVGLMIQLQPGQVMLCGRYCHIVFFELAGVSRLAGIMPVTVDDSSGKLDLNQARDQLEQVSNCRPALLALENTHNAAGGQSLSPADTAACVRLARQYKLATHIDGARIFNAAIAQNIKVAELAAGIDTICFCLSKGLGAPAGSILCGSDALIKEARRLRKMLGGHMRQTGILAAAGIYALERVRDTLTRDHQNAQLLLQELAGLPGMILPDYPITNIVMLDFEPPFPNAFQVADILSKHGVETSPFSSRRLRLTTHWNISRADCEFTIRVLKNIAAGKAAGRGRAVKATGYGGGSRSPQK